MVFDRRFNAASSRYLGSASNAQQQKRRAPPAALGLLRPLDPVLLNGVRHRPRDGRGALSAWHQGIVGPDRQHCW